MPDRRKPLVIVTRKLPDVIETRMMELFDARLNLDDRAMTRDELAAAMAEADVLVPTVTDTVDAGVIAAAGPRLKLIASFGTGARKSVVQGKSVSVRVDLGGRRFIKKNTKIASASQLMPDAPRIRKR